jgi:hypothetical protein
MTNSTATIPELSKRVAALVEKIFPSADAAQIRGMIREFHWAPEPLLDERIHLDILEVCDGKIEKVRELVELAKIDWRDLIMVAEYEVTEGKIVLKARGQSRLAEIAMRKRQRTADGE